MASDTAPDSDRRRRVRVWFGPHVIGDYSADQSPAEHYAAAMRQRFVGLDITIDNHLTGSERPVPAERLWDVMAP